MVASLLVFHRRALPGFRVFRYPAKLEIVFTALAISGLAAAGWDDLVASPLPTDPGDRRHHARAGLDRARGLLARERRIAPVSPELLGAHRRDQRSPRSRWRDHRPARGHRPRRDQWHRSVAHRRAGVAAAETRGDDRGRRACLRPGIGQRCSPCSLQCLSPPSKALRGSWRIIPGGREIRPLAGSIPDPADRDLVASELVRERVPQAPRGDCSLGTRDAPDEAPDAARTPDDRIARFDRHGRLCVLFLSDLSRLDRRDGPRTRSEAWRPNLLPAPARV